jgi:hypothetical protein
LGKIDTKQKLTLQGFDFSELTGAVVADIATLWNALWTAFDR